MSGPCCEICGHFRKSPLSEVYGECYDRSKIISWKYGGRVSSEPSINKDMECCHHTALQQSKRKRLL